MLQNTNMKLTVDNLSTYLNEKLAEYYPAGVPSFAQERLNAELSYMTDSHTEEAFLLCHALSASAVRSGHILQLDGVSVGSMLVFLLTQSRINPLPAHYYCPICGHFELAESITFGLDLPEKLCSKCGEPLHRDGFSIPIETTWRHEGKDRPSLEYHCSDGFFPFGYQTIKAFYAQRGRAVVIKGAITSDDNTRRMEPVGVFILPEGKTSEDYPQFAAYLADGTPCLAGDYFEMDRCGIQRVILAVSNIADAIYRGQAHSGLFCEDISIDSLLSFTSRDLTNTMLTSSEECAALQKTASSFYEMACALTLPHNTYGVEMEPIRAIDILRYEAFEACPLYCREDVFDRMIADGFDRERATKATYAIRTGRAAHSPVILEHLGVPEDIAAIAAHCMYLFPRGSGAQKLVSLLILSYYMQENPQCFFSAVFI